MLFFLNSALRLLSPSRNLAGLFSSVRVRAGVDVVFDCVYICKELLKPAQKVESLRLLTNLGEHGKQAAKIPDATSMSDHELMMDK